ncbi:nuclear condensin complex subunit isoform A [Micractinium conductrix]|uniref:Nuclear condensin complex subunit isoform A n=1 Tax=Micractinium conductrix TaxID=554055 RepID=A0A2P6VL69_9CHLO|nr:nuclear condensin complex subunit isoform A [Micractinium conductrix]|eukprot:PSC74824.1 nuclear condensin complex subunit isoform A [Micractinium conductrix]
MKAPAFTLQRGPVVWRASAPFRAHRPLVCRAVASAGGTPALPSAWVAQCLERAQRTAVQLEDGQHYIPLTEAQRWFKAGQHEGDAQHAEHLNAVLAEQGRLQGEMRDMAQAEYEQSMRRLLGYALSLEAEVEAAKQGMKEAAMEAAHEAEEKLLLQYQQMLLEYEAAHEAETHAVEQSLRGQVAHLEKMLHAAHEAKRAWRARAMQAEEQFTQLRGLIQSSLAAASEAATQRAAGAARDGGAGRAAGQAGEEQPPPPLHKDPRIRSTETISSADADVSAAHPREPSAHHRAFKPPAAKKKPRRAAEPYPEMHSL